MKNKLKLINMENIEIEEIKWVWAPYIPYGKVTIVQGDPGEGKTTFVLALIALLTTGKPLPESSAPQEPINVIYQTAEDGLSDTIKPRLVSAGADCSRVQVIDESEKELTMCDERLEEAILKTGARLVVLDPMQAYLGGSVDMHRANEVRPIFKKLAALAENTGCAIILIGHMNKTQGVKSSYRGLGSIDFRAAARSVLVVGRMKDEPTIRIVAHDKSSLAPEGKAVAFELHPDAGFAWKGFCDTTVDELLAGRASLMSKTTQAENLLTELLTNREAASDEILSQATAIGISERTLKNAKQNLGVKSRKVGDRWFSFLE